MIDDNIFRDEIEASLRHASDGELTRIIHFVDRLPSRAKLDDVLAPVRGRLALARPARSAAPGRVLTAPLEPLLTAPSCADASPFLAPRDVLSVFHAVVFDALPRDELAALEEEGQSALMTDCDAVIALGRRLWPAAAAAIRRRLASSDLFPPNLRPPGDASPGALPAEASDDRRDRLLVVAGLLDEAEQLTRRFHDVGRLKIGGDAQKLQIAVDDCVAWAESISPTLKRCVILALLRLEPLDPAVRPNVDEETLAEALAALTAELELTFTPQNRAGYPVAFTDALHKLAVRERLAALWTPGRKALTDRLAALRLTAIDLAAARLTALLNDGRFAAPVLAALESGRPARREDAADAESLARTAAKIALAVERLGGETTIDAVFAPWIDRLDAAAQSSPSPAENVGWSGRFAALADYLRLTEILLGPAAAKIRARRLGAWPV